jgi:hypothetical protein
MYLAGVLVLCALHTCLRACPGSVPAASLLFAPLGRSALRATLPQEPAKPEPPKSANPPPDQPKPDAGSEKPESGQTPASEPASAPAAKPPAKTQPGQKPPGTEKSGTKKKPASAEAAGNSNTVVREGSTSEPTTQPKSGTKKKPAPAEPGGNSKTVVREGSTSEPTTRLAPGMTAEQAAQQRKNTNQLLSATDSALQKLSGRLLNTDEQNTVAQIRKFMQQAKAAESDGDLELSYKLALKAQLLSEALNKP